MEFNLLPSEIHLEIFAYLSVREVRKIRQVCKQWNGLINSEFKFRRLRCREVGACDRDLLYGIKWNSEFDFCFKFTRAFLDYTSANPKFSRVKYLYARLQPIYARLEDAFDFLNSFTWLEDVRIVCDVLDRRHIQHQQSGAEKKTVIVSLNRLKRAIFDFYWNFFASKVSVMLDLPSLLYLTVESLANVQVGYPKMLRTLTIGRLFDPHLDCSQFPFLVKICSGKSDMRWISAGFIEKLPSVRELHFDFDQFRVRRVVNDHDPPEPASSSGKATVRIFHLGFETSLDQIHSKAEKFPRSLLSGEAATRFISRNLNRSVDNNSFVWTIDYNSMTSELNDTEMLSVMPQKYPNIYYLRISGTVADPHRLLKFIGQFKISYFILKGASLPQWFFRKLPENGPFIQQLQILSEASMNILSGDFDFVLELKNLRFLAIEDCKLSLNFVVGLLRKLKSINCVRVFQPQNYEFRLDLRENFPVIPPHIYLNVNESRLLSWETSREEAPKLLNIWSSQLMKKTDGCFCPRELFFKLRHLQFERQTYLFMMKKYLYDQRYSICLSKQQMRLR